MTLGSAVSVFALPPCGNPTPGTAAGGKARFLWKDSTSDARDRFAYEGTKGDAVSAAQLGNPASGPSAYRICIWDTPRGAASPRLLYDAEVPAGGTCSGKPCWKVRAAKGNRDVRFRDPARRNSGGVELLEVRTKGSCSVSWSLVAAGVDLPDLAPSDGNLLAQHDAVIVEIRNGDGLLVRSRFSAPA